MDNGESARAREIKNKGNQFRGKNNIKIFDKIRNGRGHQDGIKLTAAIKKNVNRNTFNISTIHVKRLTMKVFEVSRCSRAKQRQGNVQKKKKKKRAALAKFFGN